MGPITSYGARCLRCTRTEQTPTESSTIKLRVDSGSDNPDSNSTSNAFSSASSQDKKDEAPVAGNDYVSSNGVSSNGVSNNGVSTNGPDSMPTDSANSEAARRQIERSLSAAKSVATSGKASQTFRLDAGMLGEGLQGKAEPFPTNQPLPTGDAHVNNAHTGYQPAAPPLPRKTLPGRQLPQKKRRDMSQLLGWAVVTVGTAALGLGVGLLIWSTTGGQSELWFPGLAITIGAQGVMIVGLLHLLANLWNASRQTHTKLAQMHDDVRRIRRTTEQSAGNNHATASGFYAELADGATPDVLLGNLRGQLDQLSARLRAE